MDAIVEFKAGKETLKIVQDFDPESPREWDNLGQMIFSGNHQHLGDKHNVEFNKTYNSRHDFIENGEAELKSQIKDVVICKAVHLYSHSGETISTSLTGNYACRWDSGTIGFAIVTKQDIRENWGIKRVTQKYIDHAEKILEGEIETLDQHIRGDVYGYVIEDEGENHIDSCYGFFGRNFATNGIIDHVDKKFHEGLKNH